LLGTDYRPTDNPDNRPVPYQCISTITATLYLTSAINTVGQNWTTSWNPNCSIW